MNYLIDVFTFQAGYNSAVVVAGTTFLGIAAGVIGTFALLRNRALMGDALAHSALPGLGVAFILGGVLCIGGRELWFLLLGATISGVLGVLCVQILSRYSRLNEDTAIGAVLSCFFGAGVVLMSIIQSLGTGEEGGLNHFIYGQTAAMRLSDAYLTLAVAGCVLISTLLLTKEFRLVSFDHAFAVSDGWPVSKIDLLMMALVVAVTVVGLQAVGLLLIIALLVIPPAAARFWTDRLSSMLVISAIIGGLSGYLGSAISALYPKMPTGAVIVLVAGAIFFVSFIFAPSRGLFSTLLANFKLSLRISEDHFLRELYEGLEISNQDQFKINNLTKSANKKWLIGLMKFKGFIEEKNDFFVFLPKGLEHAKAKVRNHRLWEEYLVTFADMPISHVDYSADLVEHLLPNDIVEKLEKSLRARGNKLPQSLHPIES